jgi:hypothetical protein
MSIKLFNRVLIIFSVVLILSGSHLSCGVKDKSQEVPNVIIVMLSGVRNSESINDPEHQYMPYLWNKMKDQGTFYSNLLTNDHEFHMPAAAAVVNGVNQMGCCDIQAPTIFQYLRKKYGWPADKTWIIGRWENGEGQAYYTTNQYGAETYPAELPINMNVAPKIKSIFSGRSVNFIEKFHKEIGLSRSLFYASNWDSISEQMFTLFKKVIKLKNPKMIEFILNGTESGHYDTYARYVLSLKRSDEMIYEIWQMIQTNPYYKDHTYLIVCPDHERDLYYMDHGLNTFNNRSRVWMYIYGPDIKKGATIDRRVYHTDIFATVAHIMNVKTHKTTGRVLKDAFVDLNHKVAEKHP